MLWKLVWSLALGLLVPKLHKRSTIVSAEHSNTKIPKNPTQPPKTQKLGRTRNGVLHVGIYGWNSVPNHIKDPIPVGGPNEMILVNPQNGNKWGLEVEEDERNAMVVSAGWIEARVTNCEARRKKKREEENFSGMVVEEEEEMEGRQRKVSLYSKWLVGSNH